MSDYDYYDDVDYVFVEMYYLGYPVTTFVTRPDRIWPPELKKEGPFGTKCALPVDKIVIRSDYVDGKKIHEIYLRGLWG